jgi:hypothetical protein
LFHKIIGNVSRIGIPIQSEFRGDFLTFRQILLREEQAFNSPSLHDSIDDFRHVRHGHAAVEKMIGLDEDRHAVRTLVEAAAGTDTGLQFGEALPEDLILQSLPDVFCAAGGARSAGILVGPVVGANKEIVLALRHMADSGGGTLA